jgi:hypothetical protein
MWFALVSLFAFAADLAVAHPAPAPAAAPSDAVVRKVAYRWMRALMDRDFDAATALTARSLIIADDVVAPGQGCKSARNPSELRRALACLQAIGASSNGDWDVTHDWSQYPVNRRVDFLPRDVALRARSTGFDTSNDCVVRVLVAVGRRPEGDRVVGISFQLLYCDNGL